MPVESLDLIASPPAEHALPPVVVLFGEDSFLRTWVLQKLTAATDAETVEGETTPWRDIRDEVSTVSLFDAGERRVVIVRGADKLVKDFRPEVEAYLAKPSSAGRLFLELNSCPANTRLYKAANSDHLLVHCGIPMNSSGKSVDQSRLKKFLTNVVAPVHRCVLQSAAAERLIDLVGTNVGMLDSEIAKLALYEKPGGTITDSMVSEIVGGWKASTIWQTIDAAAAGNAAEALKQLDRMIASGEPPISLLPLIAWSMRRFGLATAAIMHAERMGERLSVSQALAAAGFRHFELSKAEAQLRQLGRQRASRILGWLLEADAKLKGSHSAPGLDRHVLEELVLRLAKS